MDSRILLVSFLLAAPGWVAAQLPAWVQPGARLRLTTTTDKTPVIGTLVSADRGAIAVRKREGADPVTIPVASLGRVEISRERTSMVGRGAMVGAMLGGGFGVAVILSDSDVGNKALAAPVFGAVFGLLYAGVGALIGASVRGDVWEPLESHDARFSISPASNGVALRMSFRL